MGIPINSQTVRSVDENPDMGLESKLGGGSFVKTSP